MADPENQLPDEQAPDLSPAPVPASEPVPGERIPASFELEELVAHIEARLMVRSEYRAHSGPLPAAETYREYAEIIPDGAERIMRMAEKEQDQRHFLEREDSRRRDKEHEQAADGLKSATLIGVVGFTVAALFGGLGYAVAGVSLAGATLVSLTYTFIAGTAIAKDARLQDGREALKGLPPNSEDDENTAKGASD